MTASHGQVALGVAGAASFEALADLVWPGSRPAQPALPCRLVSWAGVWASTASSPPPAPDLSSRAEHPAYGGGEDLERVAALVQLAQRGDGEAFGLLYERYVDLVYRYVYYRIGSHHLAEDLTAETFTRALRRLDSFTWTGRDIGAWFVTIARNIVIDHVKSSRYRLETPTGELLDGDETPSTEEEVLARLRDQRLVEAMRDLKPEQQECLSLRFLQGMSLAETAEVLGRSEGAVKQLQLRAVRSLHRALGGERP